MTDVLFSHRGRLGEILLNRPQAINALTHPMVTAIQAQLDVWADDDSVQTVLLVGAGERGLCAGGDIVALFRDATGGDGEESASFWLDEYRLNSAIHAYRKPFVAIMDGVVLGGGIGLSAHASHRVVTERSKLGMPETGIGFVPDVGGTRLLSHAPGELGTFLGLTAGMMRAGDAIATGFADRFVPSVLLPQLLASLETVPADEAIRAVAAPAPTSALESHRPWIDAAFSADRIDTILDRLRESPAPGAAEAAETVAAKSPTALAVTLASLRRARDLGSLEETLIQEYRVSLRFLTTPDFAEGVRAQVIDKDRDPQWRPNLEDGVDEDTVASYFAPLENELTFPTIATSARNGTS